ncbi:hypothetical protein C9374_002524 [Naegleria lovaniensis]|uniref:Uncharacterized protein n=1 Tax=Naegleria lovaniensis TaxID=51637 RepID=A0AA88GPZ0_NAELO|nr:uncharacterized protein C9374_002524 [Naegleria lovaniensis]KAG2386780.1 hypothetical protein C9374_002524 [Naegleria lovaniensis]
MTTTNTEQNNIMKSDLQKIKDLLSELEKSSNDNHTTTEAREPLFQQLVVLLKKNSQIILQFVSDKLSLLLKLLEHQIQFGEFSPSAYTSYGYLAHHETISKLFTSSSIQQFFQIMFEQTKISKKSLSLAVWCLGVQRFVSSHHSNIHNATSTTALSQQQSSSNPIEPFAAEIFKCISYGINNPYQSHTTTTEALNTLLVIINQLQEVSAKHANVWLVDVLESLISPHKNICIAAEKVIDLFIFKQMLPFHNNKKFQFSEEILKTISQTLMDRHEKIYVALKQNLTISIYDSSITLPQQPLTSSATTTTHNSWHYFLPEFSNRQCIIALKAWGLIVYFLGKNLAKDNICTQYHELLKSKLSIIRTVDNDSSQSSSSNNTSFAQSTSQPSSSTWSSQRHNEAIIGGILFCECIDYAWSMLIQTFQSHKPLYFHTSKGRLSLIMKPLFAGLKVLANSPNTTLGLVDKRIHEMCYRRIIFQILPDAAKNTTLLFELVLKPFYDAISSKELTEHGVREQLILFLSQWLYNDQRETLKKTKKRKDSLLDDDSDDEFREKRKDSPSEMCNNDHRVALNDISFLVKKQYSSWFEAPCLKQEGVLMCTQSSSVNKILNTSSSNPSGSVDYTLSPLQKLEFIFTNFKWMFEGFLEKLFKRFLVSFKLNSTENQDIANRFSKVLNCYFRSLCQVVVSYIQHFPKTLSEEEKEKYSSLVRQLISRLATFCLENVVQSFQPFSEVDSSGTMLQNWTQEMTLLFLKSFFECIPLNTLMTGHMNGHMEHDHMLPITLDLKDIFTKIFKTNVVENSEKKSPLFAILHGLFEISLRGIKGNSVNVTKATEIIFEILSALADRLFSDSLEMPDLYYDHTRTYLELIFSELLFVQQKVFCNIPQNTVEMISLTKVIECQMLAWQKFCTLFRDSMRIIDSCFSLMSTSSEDDHQSRFAHTSAEIIQKRKSQAQQLKNYLAKHVSDGQRSTSESSLTSKAVKPEFVTCLMKLIFFPFDLLGSFPKSTSGQQNQEQLPNDMKDVTNLHFTIMNDLFSNDGKLLHTLKDVVLLYGSIYSSSNLPPFNYISKHLKTTLTHAHLQHICEDLSDKLQYQYVCILSNLNADMNDGMISSSFTSMRNWFLYGTKILSLICTLCHESQRFKGSILTSSSGKTAVHTLQNLLKHFVWMIFDYRRQQQYTPQTEPLFSNVVQLMTELKKLLSLSRSMQHALQFAIEYSEEILFDKDFTNLFEFKGAMKSKSMPYSTDEMLQFASLCENIWECVFSQLSKWATQDSVKFDQILLNQMENIFILGMNGQRNSKLRKVTIQFWRNTFAKSSCTLSLSQTLKETFLNLLKLREINMEELMFPLPQNTQNTTMPLIEDVPTSKIVSHGLDDKKPNDDNSTDLKKRKRGVDAGVVSSHSSSMKQNQAIKEDSQKTKKVKLTKSQKEKFRERKETRLVVPEMNPSLLSSSMLSTSDMSDDDDYDDNTPPMNITFNKAEQSTNLVNISDIVADHPKNNISNLDDSSLLDIKKDIVRMTPVKSNNNKNSVIDLITPDYLQRPPAPALQLSPIRLEEDEEKKNTSSSVEDLFAKLESGCTPQSNKMKVSNESLSISFTVASEPIIQKQQPSTNDEDKSTTVSPSTTCTRNYQDDNTQITPILKKSPTNHTEPLSLYHEATGGIVKKHVRFESLQDSNETNEHHSPPPPPTSNVRNEYLSTTSSTFMKQLELLHDMISTHKTCIGLNREERKLAIQKVYSMLGCLLQEDE